MKLRVGILVISAAAISPLLSAEKTVCAEPEAAQIKISNFQLRNASVVDALRQLRDKADPNCLIVSLEVVPFRTVPERNLSFTMQFGTVRQVLQKIALQDARYAFERINSKLIHVFPVQGKRNPKDLLNVEVKNFSAAQIQFDSFLKYPNQHIPELQMEIIRRSNKAGTVGSVMTGVDLPKISISLARGTVRDLLNIAAQQTEEFRTHVPSGWIYQFRIDKSIPLGGQPSWDLF